MKYVSKLFVILFITLAVSCGDDDTITNPPDDNIENPDNPDDPNNQDPDPDDPDDGGGDDPDDGEVPDLDPMTSPVVLAYFPSWSENYVTSEQNSKLREIPSYVNYVFLSFAKPNLTYVKGSYDISQTGIEVPYDGCTLVESVDALKNKGIRVILSIGGETYWNAPDTYNINYQQIKDLVDDMGFAGIDWDYEPDGSFAGIGNPENVQHFIDFFNNSRAIMPKEKYILACAPAGVGAIGGQLNNDPSSPYSYENRNTITGENDTNLYNGSASTNGINLYGFTSTGHMIPVIEAVGNKIDLIAYQGYNTGGSQNRTIMYDAYAHYAKTYGFKIAAGTHFPNEPWGPYYTYTHENVADLADHITNHPDRQGELDGVMIWQLLLSSGSSSSYSYLNVASRVLNGSSKSSAISNANNYDLATYSGGGKDCSGEEGGGKHCGIPDYKENQTYANPNTKVYHEGKIWQNKWYANPGEIPGQNEVWEFVENCDEE
ncbi:glycosyl hydrolase family 18 protein [Aureivirga sp. CE67]|uniref:glycosyl hydrolase family 18 protein n=1 Tax=Aureivirga sp. CE67 TaxID=1788983 RepID=UPI0018CB5A15|nr:glycosyl hydrolase family 18 protein [Aureivirga sp. CE67]